MDHILDTMEKVSTVTPYFGVVLDLKHQGEVTLKLW